MAGAIKRLLDELLEQRAGKNPILLATTRAKLMLKGIDPTAYDESSPDEKEVIDRLRTVAAELGVILRN